MPEPLDTERRLFDAFPPVSTEAWLDRIHRDLKGRDFDETLVWDTGDGIRLQPFYRREDVAALGRSAPIIAPHGPRQAPNAWRIRQDVSAGDLTAAAGQAREAVAGGADDVGFVSSFGQDRIEGVPVQSQDDMATLLRDVSFQDTGIHLRWGNASPAGLAMLINEAERRHTAPDTLRGSLHLDPFGHLAATGEGDANRVLDDLAAWLPAAHDAVPGMRLVTVSEVPYDDGGANGAQKLALLLAGANAYLGSLTDAGLPAEVVAQCLQFEVAMGTHYFVEIARLRALRLAYRQLLRAYGAERDAPAFVQATTSRHTLTAYGRYVNLLRGTTEAAAAIAGGCDVLSLRPFDAATGTGSDVGARLARNTQLLLRHEAYLDRVADPAAGSYYVEQATDAMARAAWTLFQKVESMGGLHAALAEGFVQRIVAHTAAVSDDAVDTRRGVLVGVNRYPDPDEEHDGDDGTRSAAVLARTNTAYEPDTTTPLRGWRSAFAEGATVGDVVSAHAWYAPAGVTPLPPHHAARDVEALRLRTERLAARKERRLRALIVTAGDPVESTALANFAGDLLGCAGFTLAEATGDDDVWADDRDVDVLVYCFADDARTAAIPPALLSRPAEHRPVVVAAGKPGRAPSGVDVLIHRHTPLVATVSDILQRLEA